MHWVREAPEAKGVEYVLYIDADMLLRKPMDPIAMGVRRGVVVSEHVGYLDVGLRNGLQHMFLPAEAAEYAGADVNVHVRTRTLTLTTDPNANTGPNTDPGPNTDANTDASTDPGPDQVHATPPAEGLKISAGGWYHFFHIEDIRKIAHRWLYYCEQMRLNPQKYWRVEGKDGKGGIGFGGADHDIPTLALTLPPNLNPNPIPYPEPEPITPYPCPGTDHDILTGDAYVGKGSAPWISEMYGYVFSAAEAKLRHILTEGVVVYPDEIGAGRREQPEDLP